MLPVTTEPDVALPPRHFVPSDFNPRDTAAIETLVESLLARPIEDASELEAWLRDWSELESNVDGAAARRYIAMTRDTADDDVKRAYIDFEREVVPLWRTLEDRLNRRYLGCAQRESLGKRYAVFDRRRAQAAEIFRAENTRLQARDTELGAQYEEAQGAITVELDGETLTAQQCSARLESTDRAVRRAAFEALAARRLEDRDLIEGIFEQMLTLRHQIARNAGFESFRDFRFAELARFDYGPEECVAFHSAVEEVVVPAVVELAATRRRVLGLDRLRPYDLLVGLSGRQPVQPFDDVDGYLRVTRDLLRAVDPSFDTDFDVLVRNGLLDLMSRPGKAPGGYNYPIEDMRLPFIFYNAVGRHDDVQTLLHEAGHALHTLACREEPLRDYREAPIEFCEVASMAMELFGLERIDQVYDADDARDATRNHFEGILESFTWFATIDAFQHWLYTHPEHDEVARREAWLTIHERFAPHVDWGGHEIVRASAWHKQGHLFGQPFYYIEYAIAQVGALQAWLAERRDHDGAIRAYRQALTLGGSRPLPELFAAAGLRFAFDAGMLRELVDAVQEKLAAVS